MPGSEAERILSLCDEFRLSLQHSANRGYSVVVRDVLYPGFRMHELTYEGLLAACAGLSGTLLRPGLNAVLPGRDHHCLWAWAGELLLRANSPTGSPLVDDFDREWVLKKLLEVSILSAAPRELTTDRFSAHGSIILSYVCFPLLEALARKACREFIEMDGKVTRGFTVPGRTYVPGDPCSSVAHLLQLVRDQAPAGSPFSYHLGRLFDYLADLDRELDGPQVLYRWRNDVLHGNTALPTVGGTVLNLAILLALHLVADRFSELHAMASERIARDSWRFGPWSFYGDACLGG